VMYESNKLLKVERSHGKVFFRKGLFQSFPMWKEP